MPDLVWDAETVEYIRVEAHEGCEQIKSLRDATLALVLADPATVQPGLMSQLATAVRLHVEYLNTLRELVRLGSEDGALYADLDEDEEC